MRSVMTRAAQKKFDADQSKLKVKQAKKQISKPIQRSSAVQKSNAKASSSSNNVKENIARCSIQSTKLQSSSKSKIVTASLLSHSQQKSQSKTPLISQKSSLVRHEEIKAKSVSKKVAINAKEKVQLIQQRKSAKKTVAASKCGSVSSSTTKHQNNLMIKQSQQQVRTSPRLKAKQQSTSIGMCLELTQQTSTTSSFNKSSTNKHQLSQLQQEEATMSAGPQFVTELLDTSEDLHESHLNEDDSTSFEAHSVVVRGRSGSSCVGIGQADLQMSNPNNESIAPMEESLPQASTERTSSAKMDSQSQYCKSTCSPMMKDESEQVSIINEQMEEDQPNKLKPSNFNDLQEVVVQLKSNQQKVVEQIILNDAEPIIVESDVTDKAASVAPLESIAELSLPVSTFEPTSPSYMYEEQVMAPVSEPWKEDPQYCNIEEHIDELESRIIEEEARDYQFFMRNEAIRFVNFDPNFDAPQPEPLFQPWLEHQQSLRMAVGKPVATAQTQATFNGSVEFAVPQVMPRGRTHQHNF